MDDSHRASRAVEVGRLLLKYRNAGIFSAVELDNPLLREAEAVAIPDGRTEEFVRDLEALGPTFIKIGQGLSTRPDFVPAPYIEALERMQDDVAPVPVEKIREVIESELGIRSDCSQMVAQYASASTADAMSEGRLLLHLTAKGISAGLRPPPELSLLGKTPLNLEAVSTALDPNLDTREVIESHLEKVLRQRLLKSLSPANLASEMIEVQELLRDSPRRVSQLLHTLAENKFRVHVTGLEESRLIESMQKIANRISAGVIAVALILGATMMMRVQTKATIFGYPALALILFVLAAGLGVTLVAQAALSDRKAKPAEQRGPN